MSSSAADRMRASSAGPETATSEIDRSRESVTRLATAVRSLVADVCVTDVSPECLDRATELVQKVSELLRERRWTGTRSRLESRRTGHVLFPAGTGTANPVAPPLKIHADDGRAEASVLLGPQYQGPRGVVHGGISTMMLDDVLGSAALSGHGVTASLKVDFRAPVPLGVPLQVQANRTVTDGRKVQAEAHISLVDAPDSYLVTASGLFLAPRQ